MVAATTDLVHDQRLQRTCGSLAAAGYQVLLVGWQRPASEGLSPQPFGQHRLRGWARRGKLFYLEFNLRLFFYLLTQRADLWVSADLDAALPCWLRARLGGQPFGYDAHELFPEVPEVVARPAVRRVWRWVEDFIVPRARLRYTVGPALAALFGQRHPGYPFGVVRNVPLASAGCLAAGAWLPAASPDDNTSRQTIGAESSLKAPHPPNQALSTKHQAPILLYQGALNAGRGLAELLTALPKLATTVPARLFICGEGDLSGQLRAQAAGLGLLAAESSVGQVEFRGFVRPEALRQLTAQATVGIMLLENVGLSYYYSLANKFFDYVQAGIPQLCVDFPEYRALNAEYEVALLVPDLAPTTLVAALARLLPDGRPGALYQRLAANCARARQHWCWQNEEPVLLALYAAALA